MTDSSIRTGIDPAKQAGYDVVYSYIYAWREGRELPPIPGLWMGDYIGRVWYAVEGALTAAVAHARADERTKVAEEIATSIETQLWPDHGPEHDSQQPVCPFCVTELAQRETDTVIARKHAKEAQ